MKKLLSCVAALAVAAILAVPASAQQWAGSKTMINAVGSTTTGYYPSSSGTSTQGATAVLIQVASASTSSATIGIEQSINGTVWTNSGTITNPDSAGELWACPASPFIRYNLSAHASGTITGLLSWRTMLADPLARECKKIATAANSFGALSVTSLTDSGLTSGRVPYASTGGLLADSSAFTFSSGALSATSFVGAHQDTVTAKASNGAISSAPGVIVITKTSALGSSTLATPTTTTHDGYILRIVSTTAYAHVVSVASGKVNGGTNTTITFTSAAIGDSVTLLAYQGVWYVIGTTGTITIT